MKTGRYSDALIMGVLKQAESGVPVSELCREHEMSNASFYKWCAEYGGMDASMVSQMKAMEAENRHLKRVYAEMSMQNALLKEALGKKWKALSKTGDGRDCGEGLACQHRVGVPHVSNQRDVLSL